MAPVRLLTEIRHGTFPTTWFASNRRRSGVNAQMGRAVVFSVQLDIIQIPYSPGRSPSADLRV